MSNLKEQFTQKLSSFTHPHVVPNLYEFLSYVKHKRRYFEEQNSCRSWLTYGAFPLHGTARYGSVRFTFGGFSTGYCTWYFFSTTSAEVPSEPYRYQNVTCKLYWSLFGRRESSLLHHWTCDMRPIDPLDLNQHSQRRIGRSFCFNKRTFLHQPQNSSVVVCWGSSDVQSLMARRRRKKPYV